MPQGRRENNMVKTWEEYYPYAYVEVMTGSEIEQLRERIFDNDYYNHFKVINKELEPETTYIIAYETLDVTALSGTYIEECIEVYKD